MKSSAPWKNLPVGTECPVCGRSVKRGHGGMRHNGQVWKCFKCLAKGPYRNGQPILRDQNERRTSSERLPPRTQSQPLRFWTGAELRSVVRFGQSCPLFDFASSLFSAELVSKVWRQYGVGTLPQCAATVFVCADEQGRIRDVKAMRYGADGKRLKYSSEQGMTVWTPPAFRALGRRPVYFGLHLLKEANRLLVLVESEKTALFAACLALAEGRSDVLYMATGGTAGYTARLQESLFALRRFPPAQLLLCPDNDRAGHSAAESAQRELRRSGIAAQLRQLTDIWPEAPDGADLADFVLFRKTVFDCALVVSKSDDESSTL